ncbi:MAG: cellulase family glycosylhydrolase [Anaerolineae bacterium]|nr:cellulase family glycosylhydrolase [Anaerolineae bacterium]
MPPRNWSRPPAFAALLAVVALMLVSCAPPLPVSVLTPLPPLQTLPPRIEPSELPAVVCRAALDQQGADWPHAISLLVGLVEQGAECPAGVAAEATLYESRLGYAADLLARGEQAAAEEQYRAALALDVTRPEAAAGLRALGITLPEPLLACDHTRLEQIFAALVPYTPTDLAGMVSIEGNGFSLLGEPFPLRGVNYFPAGSVNPVGWLVAGRDILAAELDLIQAAGFNVVRVALALEMVFQCPGSGAVPRPEMIARLDAFIQAAAARGLRVLLVLNHVPDLTDYPLYSSPAHTLDQLRFIVERYRDEPALLAWDVRAGGDADYRAEGAAFTRLEVLTWLAEVTALVREWDAAHPVTAAWEQDELATIPYVDFVSFQHWDSIVALRTRLANLRVGTRKPLVMAAFGYSAALMPETRQAQFVEQAITVGELDGLAGWLVWAAFDGAAGDDPGGFGLWAAAYEPRAALELVTIHLYEAATPEAGP